MKKFSIKGQFVDLSAEKIYPAEVIVEEGRITGIRKVDQAPEVFICPGFIDAHIHIESSMLVPTEFARLAVVHGTVSTVSDPHEIANVLGVDGVQYMIENGEKSPFKFYFGAPSCVPATTFETAGDVINSDGVAKLLDDPRIKYLSEMMNFPGVLQQDSEVMAKIEAAKKRNKPIDGHAPGLTGDEAEQYISAGISTDHECYSYDEGLHKLEHGMKVIIREGSAAKNYPALAPLIEKYHHKMMFCSDDKHPDDLINGHINEVVARAVSDGYDLFAVLKMACIHPIEHYHLDTGRLREGDPADFIMLEDLDNFKVQATYLDGIKVAENGKSLIKAPEVKTPNRFRTEVVKAADFQTEVTGKQMNVIAVRDGELITTREKIAMVMEPGEMIEALPDQDILKIAVVNRYQEEKPAIAFVKNVGLANGAIASSVAHDSHNIVVVGSSDAFIADAVNALIQNGGGVSAVGDGLNLVLPLNVAGLMSDRDGETIAREYEKIDQEVKRQLGCRLQSPFMTLSFLALLVIPEIKLSDQGLFDGNKFEFIPVFD